MSKKHIILSGGSKGLGAYVVQELLQEGYAVSTCSRESSVRVVGHSDDEWFFHQPCDIAVESEVFDFVQNAVRRHGRPYGLVNNAAIALDGVLATQPTADLQRMLNVNLGGSLLLTREVVRHMLIGRGGRILNVTSIIGLRGYSGLVGYSATKSGLLGMTLALSRELGSRGITVNAVAPGYLDTEMSHGLSERQRQQIIRRTPLGRLGRVEDVYGLLSFLLSDSAGFITGQVISVDGGISA